MEQALAIMRIPPACLLILGALLIPLFKGKIKSGFMLTIPVAAFIILWSMPDGSHWTLGVLDYDLILGRIDSCSVISSAS